MNKLFHYVVVIIAVLYTTTAKSQGDPTIYFDDFYGNTINDDIWYTNWNVVGGDYPHSYESTPCNYPSLDCAIGGVGCCSPDNVIIANNMCELRVTQEYVPSCYSGGQQQEKWYKQGALISKRKFKYGVFEARIKIDVETGTWPAFWLFGEDVQPNYRTKGEIDIFEINSHYHDKFTNNWHRWYNYNTPWYHSWDNNHSNPQCDESPYCSHEQDIELYDINGAANFPCINNINIGSTIDNWHTYKVIWAPNYIAYYIDENLIRTEERDFTESMHIIINISAWAGEEDSPDGQTCPSPYLKTGSPVNASLPISMYIDYVKVTPILQCQNLDYCTYYQNWGNTPTAYYAENISIGGNGCNFSFDQVSPTAALDAMDLRAINSIVLKPGFRAHSEMNTDQYGISRPSIFTARIAYTPLCDLIPFGMHGDNSDDRSFMISDSLRKSNKIIEQIMPNPARDELNLILFSKNHETLRDIKIYNSLGEQVFNQQSADSKIRIDVSALSMGIYTLTVIEGNISEHKKIVIAK